MSYNSIIHAARSTRKWYKVMKRFTIKGWGRASLPPLPLNGYHTYSVYIEGGSHMTKDHDKPTPFSFSFLDYNVNKQKEAQLD